MGLVRPHWYPFLFAHFSLLATAVYSKNRVVPFWADPVSHWLTLIFALPWCVPRWWSHQRQWAIKHSRMWCHLHVCSLLRLVLTYHKGVFTIISIPLELRYPCKITEISCFTRMSIVPVHHLSYLFTPE